MRNRRVKVLAGALAVSVLTIAGSAVAGAAVNSNSQLASAAKLTEDEALKKAREDAGVKAKEIDQSRVYLDYDDGILSYDVEFYVGNEEYDYEIDAETGKILSKDYEIERDFWNSKNKKTSAKVSEAEAKKTALKQVNGATENDIRIKLDWDDGQLIYEGDIFHNEMEYEFEINADTGKIISWESESEWDD